MRGFVFGRGEPGAGGDQGSGLRRRCHLIDEVLESEVWYTRTLQEGGRTRRVYASPEAYWQLPEDERAAYRRESNLARGPDETDTRAPERPTDRRRASRRSKGDPARSRGTPRRAGDPQAAIEVMGLAKTYPDGTQAVKGVSFTVERGEIFGLLGPNGAGKSTTIGMLGTLVKPTAGRARVGGHDIVQDPTAIKPILGFALQEVGVDELATGREFLRLQARLFGIGRARAEGRAMALLKLVGLVEAADKRIESYSGGMKRKIDLASALIHEPDIIFLDEPTEGLDPRARQDMWELLEGLRRRMGATILLSTHYMEEADRLCDRVAIIDEGRLVARGTPEELKASIGRQSISLGYSGADSEGKLDRAETLLSENGLEGELQRSKTELYVYVEDPATATPRILKALDTAGVPPDSLQIQKATLDDVYLSYTGRSLEEAETGPGGKAR